MFAYPLCWLYVQRLHLYSEGEKIKVREEEGHRLFHALCGALGHKKTNVHVTVCAVCVCLSILCFVFVCSLFVCAVFVYLFFCFFVAIYLCVHLIFVLSHTHPVPHSSPQTVSSHLASHSFARPGIY